MKLRLWHGSSQRIEAFDPSKTIDGGFHLGSEDQARMRNPAWLHEVEVEVERIRRSRDEGGNWRARVERARADGFQAIVYLNRYEGMTSDIIERLQAAGQLSRLDDLTDKAFKKLVPEARDSLIVFDPGCIRILACTPGKEKAPREPDSDPSP